MLYPDTVNSAFVPVNGSVPMRRSQSALEICAALLQLLTGSDADQILAIGQSLIRCEIIDEVHKIAAEAFHLAAGDEGKHSSRAVWTFV